MHPYTLKTRLAQCHAVRVFACKDPPHTRARTTAQTKKQDTAGGNCTADNQRGQLLGRGQRALSLLAQAIIQQAVRYVALLSRYMGV